MFVVDAFPKNPDRNNGNWGVLMKAPLAYELAPVYDLGSSLFSKRSASVVEARHDAVEDVEQDAFGTNVSCYRLPFPQGAARRYIRSRTWRQRTISTLTRWSSVLLPLWTSMQSTG